MEWKRMARKAQAPPELLYFLWLARMAIPRTSQLWPLCFSKSKFSTNVFLCLFYVFHFIMVDCTQLDTELQI